MNQHQRREAKAARRRKRTTGATRGKVRGPITRAKERADLERRGQDRLLAMSHDITAQLGARGVRVRARRRRQPDQVELLSRMWNALTRRAAA